MAEPVEPPLRDTVSPVAALAAAVMLLCSLALTQADTLQRQIDMAERFVADYELLAGGAARRHAQLPPCGAASTHPSCRYVTTGCTFSGQSPFRWESPRSGNQLATSDPRND